MMISKAREVVSSSPATQTARHRPPPPPPPAKSNQPLHNFALPPLLKWGSKRTVRLEKPDPGDPEFTLRSFDTQLFGHHPADNRRAFRRPPTPPKSSRSPYHPPPLPPPAPPAGGGDGVSTGKRSSGDHEIEGIREKFVVHLHTSAKKMKLRVADVVPVPDAGASAADEDQSRPWNLRIRRSACRAPDDDSRRRVDVPSSSAPPSDTATATATATVTATVVKSNRLRSMAAERDGGEKKERRKFTVVLFKDEIEEDIFAMTGSRPVRRPKKRPRNVQKDVDMCLPGLWLSEVTADMYKVSDFPLSGKT